MAAAAAFLLWFEQELKALPSRLIQTSVKYPYVTSAKVLKGQAGENPAARRKGGSKFGQIWTSRADAAPDNKTPAAGETPLK